MPRFDPASVLSQVSFDFLRQMLAPDIGLIGAAPDADQWKKVKDARAALAGLPTVVHERVVEWARLLHELRDHHGQAALAHAVAAGRLDPTGEFEAIECELSRAAWVSLRSKGWFEQALQAASFDALRSKSMCKIRRGMPRGSSGFELFGPEELERQLTAYYDRKQSRGRKCTVEYSQQGQYEHVFVAYLADYPKTLSVFDASSTRVRFQRLRPGFKNLFIYNTRDRTLAIYSSGGTTAWNELQKLFATAVLREEIDAAEPERAAYHLDHVVGSDFHSTTTVQDGLDEVSITRVALQHLARDQGVEVRLGRKLNEPLPIALARCLNLEDFHPTSCRVSSVEFCFVIRGRGARAKSVRVKLREDSSVGLEDLEPGTRDMIKGCLVRWGIQNDET